MLVKNGKIPLSFGVLCPDGMQKATKVIEEKLSILDRYLDTHTSIAITEMARNDKGIMNEEWFELDVVQNEEVQVLQPDKTWKSFRGPKFSINYVKFSGKPEEIAKEIQNLRDSIEFGNHAMIVSSNTGIAGDGNINFYVKLYITSLQRKDHEVLQKLDKVILYVIGQTLLNTARETEQILVDMISKNLTLEEDRRFFQLVENTIWAMKVTSKEKEPSEDPQQPKTDSDS